MEEMTHLSGVFTGSPLLNYMLLFSSFKHLRDPEVLFVTEKKKLNKNLL